jgi:hypothetical protein
MQSTELLGPALSDAPAPGVVQAYVPQLAPLERVEPGVSSGPKEGAIVRELVTVDPRGAVAHQEALNGPADLRQAAASAVKKWRFQPVVRNGQAVFAYTDVSIAFASPAQEQPPESAASPGDPAAIRRLSELEQAMPRSPAQVLADLENDSEGDGPDRRFHALGGIAKAALAASSMQKAEAAARELLAGAADRPGDLESGNAIYTGYSTLGLVALSRGNIGAARAELLAAGRTKGSPQLNSFGPDVTLAKTLLERGERDVVLQFFDECRAFWKQGQQRLDQWSELVRQGLVPEFGQNLRY